jgi:hypothetical protein
MSISTLWIFWLSLTPLIDRDATRFHLPFAKLWAENSFLYFRPYFAYYDLNMLNLNYLYMLVFKFGLPDQFTKIIHASFLIAGGYLIFKYFKDKYGFNWGALSFIFYVTIPIHQRLSSEVYVDLGLLFFSTLAIIYFIKWIENDFLNRNYLFISALGAGLSFGTKYNSMVIVFFLILFTGLVIAREKKDDKLALKSMLIYALIVLICASPWLIRNFVNSGNPFFPLFNSIIPTNIIMPSNLVQNVGGETAWRIIENNDNFITLMLLPFRVFFEGMDHNFLKFDGVLNPFMLIGIIFIFVFKNNKKEKSLNNYLFSIFIIVYLVTLYVNNIRIRYFIPILPIVIILNIHFLKNYIKTNRILSYLIVLLIVAYNFQYSFTLSKNIHLLDFNPLSAQSKELYLKRYLRLNNFFVFINKYTPIDSVVYESMTGGRSYYIERTFYSDTTSLDRYLLTMVSNRAKKEEFVHYFNNLPNSSLKATHLLFKPKNFKEVFFTINYDENDPDNINNLSKIQGFMEFINDLQIIKKENDLYLFKL